MWKEVSYPSGLMPAIAVNYFCIHITDLQLATETIFVENDAILGEYQ